MLSYHGLELASIRCPRVFGRFSRHTKRSLGQRDAKRPRSRNAAFQGWGGRSINGRACEGDLPLAWQLIGLQRHGKWRKVPLSGVRVTVLT